MTSIGGLKYWKQKKMFEIFDYYEQVQHQQHLHYRELKFAFKYVKLNASSDNLKLFGRFILDFYCWFDTLEDWSKYLDPKSLGQCPAVYNGWKSLHIEVAKFVQSCRPNDMRPSRQSLQMLIIALKSPNTPQKQLQIMTILKQNPSLMAAFIEQRARAKQRQQGGQGQGQPGGTEGPQNHQGH